MPWPDVCFMVSYRKSLSILLRKSRATVTATVASVSITIPTTTWAIDRLVMVDNSPACAVNGTCIQAHKASSAACMGMNGLLSNATYQRARNLVL